MLPQTSGREIVTVNLTDKNGVAQPGISFGSSNIPVDGFFDSARQAIVIEDIIPTGGEIVIAGQILSTVTVC